MQNEVTLSTFTRSPGRVLPLLDEGDVILTRRNAPPLRLTLAAGGQPASVPIGEVRESAVVGEGVGRSEPSPDPIAVELGNLLAALLSMTTVRQLAAVLPATCPWMGGLPPAVRRSVVADVVASNTPGGTGDEGTSEPGPGPVLAQWRSRSALFARG